MTLWEERAARNEALFREVNERVRELDGDEGVSNLVCECADDACLERLRVPAGVYEAVRGEPRRFLLTPGHEDATLERVVERHDGYIVVEKTGAAGSVAERVDPRA